MLELKFTENFNGKLFTDIFSDLRLADFDKFSPGNHLTIMLRKHNLGVATVLGFKCFSFKRLNDTTAYANCGQSAVKQAMKLRYYYQHVTTITDDTSLMLVTLKWKQRHMKVQNTLLQDWWQDVQEAYPFIANHQTID